MSNNDTKRENLKVAVIGFGRIGKIVSKLLMSYGCISEIMVYSSFEHTGYIEELGHINAWGIQINVLPTMEKVKEADFIIISSSVDYAKLVLEKTLMDEWKIELQYNAIL